MALMLLTSLEYHVLVTLPLLVLSAVFHSLLPLGITSMIVSLTLCVAAGIQAELPKRKKQFWSRPLVALLFFLQPIFRGWARYQGRLSLRQTPLSAHETLDSLDVKKQDDRSMNSFIGRKIISTGWISWAASWPSLIAMAGQTRPIRAGAILTLRSLGAGGAACN